MKLQGLSQALTTEEPQHRRRRRCAKPKKDRLAAEKTTYIYNHKQKAKAQVGKARTEAQKSFVQTVAEGLGRDPDQVQFDADGLSPEPAKKGAVRPSRTSAAQEDGCGVAADADLAS